MGSRRASPSSAAPLLPPIKGESKKAAFPDEARCKVVAAPATSVACFPLATLCRQICTPRPTKGGQPSPWLSSAQSEPSLPGSDEGELRPEDRGIPHFGRACSSFSDLSHHLPSPDYSACLAGLEAFEAAVQDLLEEPSGKALCDAYGGRRGCLLRFLKARDADVKRASEMIRATAKWRDESHVNSLASMPASELRSLSMSRTRPYWPGYCVGVTKDGSPVLYTNVKAVSFELFEFDEESLRLLYIGWMERGLALQTSTGEHTQGCSGPGRPDLLPQNIEVFNFAGMSPLELARKALLLARSATFLTIGTTHYPEHLRKCYILNAPSIFSLVTNLVLKTLPASTRCKIEISSDSNFRAFREFMEPEQIEAMLGFSTHPSKDNAKAIAEVQGMMATWKEKHGLKRFAEL